MGVMEAEKPDGIAHLYSYQGRTGRYDLNYGKYSLLVSSGADADRVSRCSEAAIELMYRSAHKCGLPIAYANVCYLMYTTVGGTYEFGNILSKQSPCWDAFKGVIVKSKSVKLQYVLAHLDDVI